MFINKKSIVKTTAVLIVSILTSFYANAQDYTRPTEDIPKPVSQEKKFTLALSIGVGAPKQDYGSTYVGGSFWDATSVDSTRLQGFAKTGFSFNITASYLFLDNVGIMAMFGATSNPFDLNTFSGTIGFPTTSPTGVFHENEYLIGPYVAFTIEPQLKVKLNALVGLVTVGYPEVNLLVNDTISELETIDFQGGKSIGYSFGIGAEYNVSDNLAVLVDIAYSTAVIKYDGWTVKLSAPGYNSLSFSHPTDITKMSTGILKTTIGIAIKF